MDPKKPQRPGDGYHDSSHNYPGPNYRGDRRPSLGLMEQPEMQCPRTPPPPNKSIMEGYNQPRCSRNYDSRGHSSSDRGYSASSRSYSPRSYQRDQRERDNRPSRERFQDGERQSRDRSEPKDDNNHGDNEHDRSGRSSRSSGRTSRQSDAGSASASDNEWADQGATGKSYYSSESSPIDRSRSSHSRSGSRGYDSRSENSRRRDNDRYIRGNLRSEAYNWNNNNFNNNNYSNNNWNNNRGEMPVRRWIKPSCSYEATRTTPQRDLGNRWYQRPTSMSPQLSVPGTSHSRPCYDAYVAEQERNMQQLAVVLPQMMTSTSLRGNANPHAEFGQSAMERPKGPSTPTTSENPDNNVPRKTNETGSYSGYQGPTMSPSLAKYFRADLTSHVDGWPSTLLEKQADRYAEEAYQLGSLQNTYVSAQLKCSRSLVRQREIEATHTDQKLMYLRQQIAHIESLKTPTNFLSDD